MEKSGGVAWTRGRASYSGSGGAPAIATSADGLPLPTFAFTHFNSHIKQTPIDFTVQSVPKNADNQTIVIIVLDGKKGQWAYWSIKTVLPSSSVSDGTPCPSVTESLCPLSSKHSESLSTSDGGALKLILYNRNNDGKMKSDGMGDMDMDMDHSMHHSSSNDDNKKSDGMMENCPDCAKKADPANTAAAPSAAAAPKGGCPHCAASAAAKAAAAKAAAASPSPAPKGGCPHCAHQASSESSDASSGHSAHGGGGCPHCSKSSSSSSSDSGMSMEGMSMGGGMTMVFTSNWRGNELLFPGWRTDTLSQYIIQLIIVFLFAFVFEFLQSFQADWDVKTAIKNAKSAHHYTAIGAIGDDDDEKLGGSLNCNPVTNELVWVPYEWGQQLFRAIIYGIRVFLSLLIMMVFMVMDFYLVTAIMLGYITGFLIFSRHRVAPQKTACH